MNKTVRNISDLALRAISAMPIVKTMGYANGSNCAQTKKKVQIKVPSTSRNITF